MWERKEEMGREVEGEDRGVEGGGEWGRGWMGNGRGKEGEKE